MTRYPDGRIRLAGLHPSVFEQTDRVDYLLYGVVLSEVTERTYSGGIEYEVLLCTRDVVRALYAVQGTGHQNGVIDRLRPSQASLDTGKPLSLENDALDAFDGDHVLICTVLGSPYQYKIITRLGHPRTTLALDASEAYKRKQGDCTLVQSEDGSLSLTLGDARITFSAQGTTLDYAQTTLSVTSSGVQASSNVNPAQSLATAVTKQAVDHLLAACLQISTALGGVGSVDLIAAQVLLAQANALTSTLTAG